MSFVWFWVAVVFAMSFYTFFALVYDARIKSKPDMSYAERYSASMRGWSTSLGFFALGDFVGTSIVYQVHGHLVDWELAPLLIGWPLVLLDLLMLVGVALVLSLFSALIPSRIRIPWLGVGIVLLVLGLIHGAGSPVTPQ